MVKKIFMLGMPSSGKSTLGKNLAKELNFEFIDLDRKIEIAEGKRINEIFNLEGEEYFRKKEAEHLRKLESEENIVVATGGGTPVFHDNLKFIKEQGISVFLDVKPEDLDKRMRNSRRNHRPLLDIEGETLLKDIQETYNARIDFYKQADITIEGDTDANTILWLMEAQFEMK